MRLRFLFFGFLLLFPAFDSHKTSAATWQSVGPDGGNVVRLAVDPLRPGTLYAGTIEGDVFKTTNGGLTWVPSSTGLPSLSSLAPSFHALAAQGDRVYAGSALGLFASGDGGATWHKVDGVPLSGPQAAVEAIAFGGNGSDVFVSASAGDYVNTTSGILRSTDGGGSFQAVNAGLVDASGATPSVTSLVSDPVRPSTLYAGTASSGVFKTTDSGGTWRPARAGLPAFLDGMLDEVTALAIEPGSSSILYATTFLLGASKSTDGGESWTAINEGLSRPSLPQIHSIASRGVSTLYLGTSYGVFRGTDAGGNWAPANEGMSFPGAPGAVNALATDSFGTVYAGSVAGFAVRSPGASSWEVRNSGIRNLVVRSVAVDPQDSRAIYLAGESRGASGHTITTGTVYRSSDGARSWAALKIPDLDGNVGAVALDPRRPETIYAGTGQNGSYDEQGAIHKSSDGGSTWRKTAIIPFRVVKLLIDPGSPSTVYAATSYLGEVQSGGIFKSTDGGESFSPASAGLPGSGLAGSYGAIVDLSFDAVSPSTLYAAVPSGNARVYRSTDGAGSWKLASTGLNASVYALAAGSSAGVVYAGTYSGVFRSGDSGDTWVAVSAGLPVDSSGKPPSIASVVANARIPGRLFVGFGGSAYESTDDGQSWSAADGTLERASISFLTLGFEESPVLYAGTWGRSLFALRPDPIVKAISPGTGSAAGGTLVILTGEGFQPDSVVTIGGVPTTGFTFFNAQTIRLRTGSHPAGIADVVVANADGASAALPAAFTYTDWRCEPSESTLCLENGRFRIEVDWKDPRSPASGKGHAESLSLKSGWFWFSYSPSAEVVVKILDGRSENGHYWVHWAALTDFDFSLQVTDTVSGTTKAYRNVAGQVGAAIDRQTF